MTRQAGVPAGDPCGGGPQGLLQEALKGISAAKLHIVTPIAPVLTMSREDKRFVASYDVTGELDDSYNWHAWTGRTSNILSASCSRRSSLKPAGK